MRKAGIASCRCETIKKWVNFLPNFVNLFILPQLILEIIIYIASRCNIFFILIWLLNIFFHIFNLFIFKIMEVWNCFTDVNWMLIGKVKWRRKIGQGNKGLTGVGRTRGKRRGRGGRMRIGGCRVLIER